MRDSFTLSPAAGRAPPARSHALVAPLVLAAGLWSAPGGTELYVVGGASHSWRSSGTTPGGVVAFVDRLESVAQNGVALFGAADSLTDWIVPVRVDPSVNISLDVLQRGGSIDVNLSAEQVDQDQLEGVINGDHKVAFDRKPVDGRAIQNNGVILTLDLGARYGVNRIAFYPRMTESFPFANDFMRGYELYLNDGLPASLFASGQPNFVSPVRRESDNSDTAVVTEVEPQFVRYLQLKSILNAGFEIDEIEVYGTGFVPDARYESLPLALDGESVWGAIDWVEAVAGDPADSGVEIRVRSGSDDTPDVYVRELAVGGVRTGLSPLDEQGTPLTEASYQRLLREGKPVLKQVDGEHWSPWQLVANGESLSLPAPRRFFQFRADFANRSLDAARALGELRFGYGAPPVDALLAEVSPSRADIGRETTFTFVARVVNATGRAGFERFEIGTPARVSAVRSVELQDSLLVPIAQADFDGVDLDRLPARVGDFSLDAVTDDHFTFTLPRVADHGTRIAIVFAGAVFRYGTRFQGRAFADGADLPLLTEDGDATPALATDDQHVRVTLGSTIAGAVRARPAVFTPNGDGVNDRAQIAYTVLHLVSPTPVTVDILDLGGHRVRRLGSGQVSSGRYTVDWDGKAGDGGLVAPGNYLVVVEIRSDRGTQRRAGSVTVAY